MRGKIADLSGMKFGKLTAISRAETIAHKTRWNCVCECGNKHIAASAHLVFGSIKSCGCVVREIFSRYNENRIPIIKHGESCGRKVSSEYSAYSHMKSRCLNNTDAAYHRYGGRGIMVCDRWLGDDGFNSFLHDMGRKPSSKYSIDRVDNNGNYDPSNCRWATKKEQALNRRTNKLVEFNGELLPITTISSKYGFSYYTIKGRLNMGWSLEKSLTTPLQKRTPKVKEGAPGWNAPSD